MTTNDDENPHSHSPPSFDEIELAPFLSKSLHAKAKHKNENENMKITNERETQEVSLTESTERDNKDDKDDDEEEVSFFSLITTNLQFSLFMASYIVAHFGEWFTYVASIHVIERESRRRHENGDDDVVSNDENQDDTTSMTAVAILIAVRLTPYILFSPFGGVLADSRDRRKTLMALDTVGTVIPLLYILASTCHSLSILYLATFVQEMLSSFYEPCQSALLPMLVRNNGELKKATTMSTLVWSTTAALGTAVGGYAVAWFGTTTCYALDSLSYLISLAFLWMVGGNWDPTDEDGKLDRKQDKTSPEEGPSAPSPPHTSTKSTVVMLQEALQYLQSNVVGALVLVKFTAAFAYGPTDILVVALAEEGVSADTDSHQRVNEYSKRFGTLFLFVGTGLFLGPLIVDQCTDAKKPRSLQTAMVWGFAIMMIGFFGMGVLLFTSCHIFFLGVMVIIRASGTSILWTESALLIQMSTSTNMLGRMSAIDGGLAMATEAAFALLAGIVMDRNPTFWSAQRLSFVLSGVSLILFGIWFTCHQCGPLAPIHPSNLAEKDLGEDHVEEEVVELHDEESEERHSLALYPRIQNGDNLNDEGINSSEKNTTEPEAKLSNSM